MTEATMTDDSAPAWAERVTRFDYDGPDAPQEVRYTGQQEQHTLTNRPGGPDPDMPGRVKLVRGPARPGPWRTVEDVELATLGWVHWHNTERLHGYLGDVPPAEFEKAFYAVQDNRNLLVEIK